MGRLFGAVASVLGVRQRIEYEGQTAIELEVLADSVRAPGLALRMDVRAAGVLDPRDMFRAIVSALLAGAQPAVLAAAFHQAVAIAVSQAVELIAGPVRLVGLTGGVFQHVRLLGECRNRLHANGSYVLLHHRVSPNDGGLALGQATVSMLTALAEQSDAMLSAVSGGTLWAVALTGPTLLDDGAPTVPAAGGFVLRYQLLWERTQVCIEHPGLLAPPQHEPAITPELPDKQRRAD